MIKILNREALVECLKNICGNVSCLLRDQLSHYLHYILLCLLSTCFTFSLSHFSLPSKLIAIGVLNKAICASIFFISQDGIIIGEL